MTTKDTICVSILTTIVFWLFFTAFVLLFGNSCTLSFQNISTHGTATDLVDQDQRADPDIDANLSIPASAL